MNWKRQWPILLLWIVMGAGGAWGMANDDAGKTANPEPSVASQLSQQEQALFDAVKTGDKEEVKKLIDAGVNVNCHCADGFSPVHVAIMRDDVNMLALLTAGRDDLDTTIVLTAKKRILMVDRCKRKNVFASLRVSFPLQQVASIWGSVQCTKALMKNLPKDNWSEVLVRTYQPTGTWPGIDIQKPYRQKQDCWLSFGETGNREALWAPFYVDLLRSVAAKHGCGDIQPKAYQYLSILDWMAKEFPQVFEGGNRFHLSIEQINWIAAEILKEMDVTSDTETVTKLRDALKILMKHGAKLDKIMDLARSTVDLPMMKALVRNGYDPVQAFHKWVHAPGHCQCDSPYVMAPYGPRNWFDLSNKIEGIYWLLKQGVQLPDSMVFDVWADKAMTNFMICLGATINPQDKKGQEVLFRLCRPSIKFPVPTERRFKLIQTLADMGVDLNIEDEFGWRAIDYLVSRVRPTPIITLLHHGADISHTEKMFSYSVLSYLIEEYTDLVAKMVHFEGNSPFSRNKGTMPFPKANPTIRHAFFCHETPLLPFLTLLIKNGADVNFISKNGLTPLMEAAMSGRMDVVVLLVDREANIQLTAQKPTAERYPEIWTGKTAIELTAKEHPEIREYLKIKAKEKNK